MEHHKPVVGDSSDPSEAAGASAAPSERLGDYRNIREVGRGGLAVVYEAEQVSLGEQPKHVDRLAKQGTRISSPGARVWRASVGSTEASESLPARVGVVGPKRATRLAVRRLARRPQQRRNAVRQFSGALSAPKSAAGTG